MSVDSVALSLALQAQHDALLRDTLAALDADVRTVAVVVGRRSGHAPRPARP